MEERSGWLERSLEQARVNIQARPEHLKPERYRTTKQKSKDSTKQAPRNRDSR